MISLEWGLGVLFVLITGSYGFTALTYWSDKKDRAGIWKAINQLKDNELKHLSDRVSVLENQKGE